MIWWYLTSKWMYPAHPFSVQFSSVAQSCPTLCNPLNHSTPGLPVHHKLPKFTQTHAIESVMPSSHLILCRPLLLLPPSLPASGSFPMSQISHEVAKVLEFQLQHQSFQWTPRTDLLDGLVGSPCSPRDFRLLQHHSSKAAILQCSAFFTAQLSHDHWKNHRLTRQTFVGKVMSLLFNMLSTLVIIFLPGSKCLLISWLQSTPALILETQKIKVWHHFHCLPIYFPWGDGTRCHDLSFLNVAL